MDEQIRKLKELVDGSDNIVFSAGRVFPPRAASPISAAWTDCITRSSAIRRRPC